MLLLYFTVRKLAPWKVCARVLLLMVLSLNASWCLAGIFSVCLLLIFQCTARCAWCCSFRGLALDWCLWCEDCASGSFAFRACQLMMWKRQLGYYSWNGLGLDYGIRWRVCVVQAVAWNNTRTVLYLIKQLKPWRLAWTRRHCWFQSRNWPPANSVSCTLW